MTKLLSGLRIIDLTMFVAGPFGTAILADLGAEVIKVEPPGGDPVRRNRIGPEIDNTSAQFFAYNRGKKSIELNLKSRAGRSVLLDLTARADAVIENFRPGVMDRLGLGHAILSGRNSALVMVSINAFGSEGPWRDQPGYDLVVQALSGMMSLTGHEETGAAHVPAHLGDTAAGTFGALALLAAVLEARRIGKGRALEVAMLDAQLYLIGDEITFQRTGHWQGEQHGSGHPALAPYAAFATADDPIVIAAVGLERFWINLTKALDRPDLRDDPRFADNARRCGNRAELDRILNGILATRPSKEWLELMRAHDVPCAQVLSLAEAVVSPQARDRGLIHRVLTKSGAEVAIPALPVRERAAADHPAPPLAPELGADAAAVLSGILGYDEATIAGLTDDQAFSAGSA